MLGARAYGEEGIENKVFPQICGRKLANSGLIARQMSTLRLGGTPLALLASGLNDRLMDRQSDSQASDR